MMAASHRRTRSMHRTGFKPHSVHIQHRPPSSAPTSGGEELLPLLPRSGFAREECGARPRARMTRAYAMIARERTGCFRAVAVGDSPAPWWGSRCWPSARSSRPGSWTCSCRDCPRGSRPAPFGHATIQRIRGDVHLDAVEIVHEKTGQERVVDTPVVFSFIGALRRTDWLPRRSNGAHGDSSGPAPVWCSLPRGPAGGSRSCCRPAAPACSPPGTCGPGRSSASPRPSARARWWPSSSMRCSRKCKARRIPRSKDGGLARPAPTAPPNVRATPALAPWGGTS